MKGARAWYIGSFIYLVPTHRQMTSTRSEQGLLYLIDRVRRDIAGIKLNINCPSLREKLGKGSNFDESLISSIPPRYPRAPPRPSGLAKHTSSPSFDRSSTVRFLNYWLVSLLNVRGESSSSLRRRYVCAPAARERGRLRRFGNPIRGALLTRCGLMDTNDTSVRHFSTLLLLHKVLTSFECGDLGGWKLS